MYVYIYIYNVCYPMLYLIIDKLYINLNRKTYKNQTNKLPIFKKQK